MILELRRSCMETIDRALLNINQARGQWSPGMPRTALQKLHSAQNDIELLKDNFTLIISKVLRLESKCNEKQTMALKVQHSYRAKFEDACQAYKILEVKHEKLGKQLNFIKFSNNCLRSQLQTLSNRKGLNNKLQKALQEIGKIIENSGQNLQTSVNKILSSIQKQCHEINLIPQTPATVKLEPHPNINMQMEGRVRSISEFSLEHPSIKQEVLQEDNQNVLNSCQLRAEREGRTRKKPKSKESQELKETASTEKKRSELAKLVEQQSRLARINERYLSTDIY